MLAPCFYLTSCPWSHLPPSSNVVRLQPKLPRKTKQNKTKTKQTKKRLHTQKTTTKTTAIKKSTNNTHKTPNFLSWSMSVSPMEKSPGARSTANVRRQERQLCHFAWTAPLIYRHHPCLLLIFSSQRVKCTWIINKLVGPVRAILICVINPEPMWFGELIKLLLLGWKFLLPAAGLDLLFICIFAGTCDHRSRSYIQSM